MASVNWRPILILLLGVLALFGVPIIRTFSPAERDPAGWLQPLAALGALLLLGLEFRGRDRAGRWRLLAWAGGLLALAWVAGVVFLWLIWPK